MNHYIYISFPSMNQCWFRLVWYIYTSYQKGGGQIKMSSNWFNWCRISHHKRNDFSPVTGNEQYLHYSSHPFIYYTYNNDVILTLAVGKRTWIAHYPSINDQTKNKIVLPSPLIKKIYDGNPYILVPINCTIVSQIIKSLQLILAVTWR